jgi:hypothetical protein
MYGCVWGIFAMQNFSAIFFQRIKATTVQFASDRVSRASCKNPRFGVAVNFAEYRNPENPDPFLIAKRALQVDTGP